MIKKQFLSQEFYFLVLLIVVFLFYDYNHIISKPPQSTHHWRQADCISFTLNLAQGDGDFFHPELHHLNSDNYTTGCGVSEAPILYYFVAQLYRLFGYNVTIYRIVNTLLFFIGLFYLFKLLKIILKKSFWIYIIPLIILASPVIAFYASNFLTDTTAFAITLIGWYYFFKFKEESKDKFLYFSFIFFTIAGLLKILSLTSFVAISFIFFLELFTNFKFNSNKKIFYKGYKHIYPFALLLIIIFAWYLYALYYNDIHHTTYFSNRITPIWEINWSSIIKVYNHAKIIHIPEYFHYSFFIFSLIIFIYNIIKINESDKLLFILTMLLFLANVSIIVLWFKAFKDHDYYFINLLMFFVFNIILFFSTLKNMNSPILKIILKTTFTIFVILLLMNAKNKLNTRYYGWRNNDYKLDKAYFNINPYLEEIGINKHDTIISIGDVTNSYTLIATGHKGWTQMDGKSKSVASIKRNIKNGAKYIFVREDKLLSDEYLQPFIKNKIGTYKNISIFSLEKIKK